MYGGDQAYKRAEAIDIETTEVECRGERLDEASNHGSIGVWWARGSSVVGWGA